MRGLFLDRDGILNALIHYADTDEWESPRDPADLRLLPGVTDVLSDLQSSGWSLFLVSNQPSFAKGKTSLADLIAVHTALETQLNACGISFQAVYYCYHHPNGIVPEFTGVCDCRKPAIGSLLRAKQSFGLDLHECWFIGDQETDILCGQAAGCRTIQIDYPPSQSKRGTAQPDSHCATLQQVPSILQRLSVG